MLFFAEDAFIYRPEYIILNKNLAAMYATKVASIDTRDETGVHVLRSHDDADAAHLRRRDSVDRGTASAIL